MGQWWLHHIGALYGMYLHIFCILYLFLQILAHELHMTANFYVLHSEPIRLALSSLHHSESGSVALRCGLLWLERCLSECG